MSRRNEERPANQNLKGSVARVLALPQGGLECTQMSSVPIRSAASNDPARRRLPASLTRALSGQRQENLVITVKESIPRTLMQGTTLSVSPFSCSFAAVGPHNGPVS